MRWRCFTTVVTVATLAAILSGSVAVGTAGDRDGSTPDAPSTAAELLERPGCGEPADPEPVAPPDLAPSVGGEVRVQFTVPSIAVVRVAADGSPTAASTNTGCAPRDDDTILVEVEGELVPADADLVAAVVASFTTGDWRQPGTWNAPA